MLLWLSPAFHDNQEEEMLVRIGGVGNANAKKSFHLQNWSYRQIERESMKKNEEKAH